MEEPESDRRNRIAACLSESPRRFLSSLGAYLGISARASYVEAGQDRDVAITRLTAFNEVHIVVLAQLASLDREVPAYPDEALLGVLFEKAQRGGIAGDLWWAATEALNEIESQAD